MGPWASRRFSVGAKALPTRQGTAGAGWLDHRHGAAPLRWERRGAPGTIKKPMSCMDVFLLGGLRWISFEFHLICCPGISGERSVESAKGP